MAKAVGAPVAATDGDTCQACSYAIPRDANFCPGCGVELLTSAIQPRPASGSGVEPAKPTLAGWWRRVGSMLMDELVVLIPASILIGVISPRNPSESTSTKVALASLFAIIVAEGAYFSLLTAKGDGRTGGNRALAIVVRDARTGAVLTLSRSFMRWFVRRALYVLVIPGILNDLWPLWDKRNQTLADKAAGSVVVRRGADEPEVVLAAVAAEEISRPAAPGRAPRSLAFAFVAFGVAVGLNIGVIELLRSSGSPGGDAVELLLGSVALWTPLVGAVVLASKRSATGSLKADFGLSLTRQDFGIGLVGSFIARGASVIVALPLYAAFSDTVKSPQIGRPVEHIHGLTFAVFAFVAVVGAPLVEELFFRGLIQTRLVDSWGVLRGVAVTSVLFGSAHLIGWRGPQSLLAAAAIAGGGGVLGYLRQRTGRLGTSMVAHAFFNLFVVVLLAFGAGD